MTPAEREQHASTTARSFDAFLVAAVVMVFALVIIVGAAGIL